MDIKKEREAFQECYKTSRDYKFYVRHEMSEKQIFEFKKGKYFVDCVNDGWKIWQSAKAQAVPEGFVLVKMDDLELLRDSAIKIKYASLNNDSDRIFSDIEDIQLSIERLIEAQEPAND